MTRIVILEQKLRGRDTAMLEARTLREKFDLIYKRGEWAPLGSESLSGPGSTMAATVGIRERLPELLRDLGVRSLLDIGCGDFNWLRHVDLPCRYTGIDVAPSVVADNRAAFAREDREFRLVDGTRDPLPPSDAALCREVIFHLSFADCARLIANIRASGARYLLATTDPDHDPNTDIFSGDFRELNLAKKPFDLGDPVRTIADGNGHNPRRLLGIWAL